MRDRKTVVRSIKLTTEEDRAVKRAAVAAGVPWSTWAREVILHAADPKLTQAERMKAAVGGAS